MNKLLRIFALGGNEVAPTGLIDPVTGKAVNPDLPAQWLRASRTCKLLAEIIEEAPDDLYVVSHGNGPQVGNLVIRAEYSLPIMPPIPLDICVADTQGAMGFMLGHLRSALETKSIKKSVATIITQVVVAADDPAFNNPTKFIGPAFDKSKAIEKQNQGISVKCYKTNANGDESWRRVVGSPKPLDIVEIDVIEKNLQTGIIPIVVGGGGIPVVRVSPRIEGEEEIYACRHSIEFRRPHKHDQAPIDIYSGVEAVIDKDLASALLGKMLLARSRHGKEGLTAEFTIFTDVDGAKLNYGKPDQADLRLLHVKEAKELAEKGNFPAGSMGPKIEAAIDFIEGGGEKAYITTVDQYRETLAGEAGTTIIP